MPYRAVEKPINCRIAFPLSAVLHACMQAQATRLLAGCLLLFASAAFSQQTTIVWENSPTTLIYTNDCAGTLGQVTGANAYRFGLYLGPLGSPPEALTLVGIATNHASLPGRISARSFIWYGSGSYTCQVRGWSAWAGATFAEAAQNPAPDVYLGASELGYFQMPGPGGGPGHVSIFGSGSGKIGGFELQKGTCRALAYRRIAPDGPVKITGASRNGVVVWTNTIASNAVYRFAVAGAVTGPYANYTTVTSSTAEVTFTYPFNASFVRVAWWDAPAPEAAGDWDYQALDSAGAVLAAGVLTFTSNVPSTVSGQFTRIQTAAQSSAVNLHPSGARNLTSSAGIGTNNINFAYGDFELRGQMTGNYFAGDWIARDYILGTPEDPPPQPGFVVYSGRFIALRREP